MIFFHNNNRIIACLIRNLIHTVINVFLWHSTVLDHGTFQVVAFECLFYDRHLGSCFHQYLGSRKLQTIFDIMASQQCRNKLPALLPAVASYSGSKSAIPEGQVLVANKTGDLVGIQHDVGIFELPDGRRYLIAMFTGDLENDSAGIAAISQVSLAVYQALRD